MTDTKPFTTVPDRYRAIADAIESPPKHFNMNGWIDTPERNDFYSESRMMPSDEFAKLNSYYNSLKYVNTVELSCGTTMCIAGWAARLFPEFAAGANDVPEAAQTILEMSDEAADAVFYRTELDAKGAAQLLRAMADDRE